MLEITKKLVPWLWTIMVFAFGWYYGSQHTDANWKEVVHNEYVQKQEATQSTQRAVNEISAKYQADLEGLEGSTDRIIADLRSDNKRLRVSIKPTTGQLQGDGRCLVDGKAELDEATARRLIGITKRGDATIEALQNTIRKLQGEKKQ